MNDILFRGKRTDNGEWVKGSLIVFENGKQYIMRNSTTWICACPAWCVEVIHETVSQFIGLKDCNENMIFENDIIMFPDKSIYNGNNEYGFVKYQNGQYILKYDNYIYIPSWQSSKEMKIYGNVFDNADLLKGDYE